MCVKMIAQVVHIKWPLQWQWKAEDMTWGKHRQKNHELHIQHNHKTNMAVTWWGTMLLYREQDGVWYPQTQVWSVEKSNYPELTGATNSGLPQKRQSPCPWPRKSPLESIAAPKLWGERKKERERYLKPTALWSLSTCCRLSDSVASLAKNCFTTRKLLHSFSFLHSHTRCNLPALFQ